MKFSSVLAVATLALASLDLASAATCTSSDLEKTLAATNEILNDSNCKASRDSLCPNTKCYANIVKLVKGMPDCVTESLQPKDTFELLVNNCRDIVALNSASETTSTTTTSGASSSVTTSAGVALSSAVLAVAMVYL